MRRVGRAMEILEQAKAGAGICRQLDHAYLLTGLRRDAGRGQRGGQRQLAGAQEQQGPAEGARLRLPARLIRALPIWAASM